MSRTRVSFALRDDHASIRFQKQLLGIQITAIISLVGTAILVGVIEFFWPDFFDYPYFGRPINLVDVLQFWPVFLYCGTLSIIVCLDSKSSHLDEELVGYEIVTSVLAGVWEEIGFRCFYICTGMVFLTILNLMLSTVAGYALGAVLLIAALVVLLGEDRSIIAGAILIALAAACFLLIAKADPVYWFYSSILIPTFSFVSFGSLDPILYNGHEPLFVMGAILANAKFRDGHKYQGWRGLLNSWVMGFVLLYAALTYGLVIAIVVHILYDVEIAAIRYVSRKVNG